MLTFPVMYSDTTRSQLALFEDFEVNGGPPNPNGRAASAETFTAKQEAFMDRYLATLNGAQAARDVGVPEGSARYAAREWLSNPHIRSELRRRAGERVRSAQLTIDGVLEQLRRLAFADMRTIYDADGLIKPMAEWSPDIAARVAGVETQELFEGTGEKRRRVGNAVKVKFWNPNDALTTIAKHLNMIVDQHNLNVSGSIELRDVSDDDVRNRARAIAAKLRLPVIDQ